MQGYHLLAAALFAPVLVMQPRLLALALGVALLVMVAAEVVRLGRVPVLSALPYSVDETGNTERLSWNGSHRALCALALGAELAGWIMAELVRLACVGPESSTHFFLYRLDCDLFIPHPVLRS